MASPDAGVLAPLGEAGVLIVQLNSMALLLRKVLVTATSKSRPAVSQTC